MKNITCDSFLAKPFSDCRKIHKLDLIAESVPNGTPDERASTFIL
ncbi:hypothetical protein [Duncaniella muris]|nr:hypothetical protein [Duncaniella muris]